MKNKTKETWIIGISHSKGTTHLYKTEGTVNEIKVRLFQLAKEANRQYNNKLDGIPNHPDKITENTYLRISLRDKNFHTDITACKLNSMPIYE